MTKSVHINMRLKPKTVELIDTLRHKAGVTRPTLIEDMLFMIDAISKNPEKLEELVGPVFYEKYFKKL